jgi:hypothetical protein
LKKLIDEMNEKIHLEKQTAEKTCDERLKENAEKVNLKTQTIKTFLLSLR